MEKVKVKLIESDRFMGKKVYGTREFNSHEEADSYIEEFNSYNDEDSVPEWYAYAEKMENHG